jgi:hypothetical protein
MFQLKIAAAALGLSAMMFFPAAAAPAPSALPVVSADSQLVQIQDRRRDRSRSRNFRRDRDFRRGRRYRSPPRGWKRYRSRPWNYRRRGCIAIGPLWFCP